MAEYREEVTVQFGKLELSAELICNVKMTSAGAPESGPTFSSGGEPAEPPEFECEDIELEFSTLQISKIDNPAEILGEDFIELFQDRAIEKMGPEILADPGDDEDRFEDYM